MNDLTISPFEQKDSSAAAHVLSLAMVSCLIHVAVFGSQDEEVRRVQQLMFDRMLRHRPGLVYLARHDDRIVGVMRLHECQGGAAAEPLDDEAALQDTESRAAYWQAVWDYHDPREPHWHLGPVGVLPELQGSGIGTALMRRFCQEVDARGAAAFLETDQPGNVRFYQGFGFQLVEEVDIFGVRNYFMWRLPISDRAAPRSGAGG
jgi:predicted N-acetyltransferase YhbS